MSVETHLTKRIRPRAPRQRPVHPCTAIVHCHAAAVALRVVSEALYSARAFGRARVDAVHLSRRAALARTRQPQHDWGRSCSGLAARARPRYL